MKKAEAKIIGLENCKVNNPITFSIKIKGDVYGNEVAKLWIINSESQICWTNGKSLFNDGFDNIHYVDETFDFPKIVREYKLNPKTHKKILIYEDKNECLLKKEGVYYLTGAIYDLPIFKEIMIG